MPKLMGDIKFELPPPLIESPYVILDFMPPEMFARMKRQIDDINLGPTGKQFYHTMIGRWESNVVFPSDIEDYCLNKAREIFKDDSLKKAYFFVCKYQIHNGCVPSLWEHYDQNGTQTTIDLMIENTADWDLRVERQTFKQPANSAILFAGQQHLHARPPYPTMDASKYTTVLFMHFTQPNHWIQTERNGIDKYVSDGDIRYFNTHRFLPTPDHPVEQEICKCHDYSALISLYNSMFGDTVDAEVEIAEMPILEKNVLAPGIVEYITPAESAHIIDGLTRNMCFRMWEPAQVLDSNRKPTVDYSARKCYVKFLTPEAGLCHPADPAARVYHSLENGISPIIEDYRNTYHIQPLASRGWSLLRYEKTNTFHSHADDAPEFPRVVSVSYFMNDDFDGGELIFPNHGITIKSTPGKFVLFSSAFPYMHKVSPVIRGNRQVAVRWYNYAGKEMTGT
jgi:hypothetical protein